MASRASTLSPSGFFNHQRSTWVSNKRFTLGKVSRSGSPGHQNQSEYPAKYPPVEPRSARRAGHQHDLWLTRLRQNNLLAQHCLFYQPGKLRFRLEKLACPQGCDEIGNREDADPVIGQAAFRLQTHHDALANRCVLLGQFPETFQMARQHL